jgi:pilus assembly protein CpaF
MSISDRLRQTATGQGDDAARPATPRVLVPAPERQERVVVDPFGLLKQRAHEALFARLGMRLFDSSLGEDQLRSYVVQEIGNLMDEETAPLSAAERQRLVAEISDDVLGHGPIERYLADRSVTEIMVNSDSPIYVERDGLLERTESRFVSRSTCDGSSSASSARSGGASTSRHLWLTHACPTAHA